MKISSIAEAEKTLHSFIPKSKTTTGDNQSLERMWPMLHAADNPQDKLIAVHVAGTSGKTSTSYYIAALLQSTGAKTGLTVSPHIDSITERVQINGSSISAENFCSDLEQFLALMRDSKSPSYFEILIVFILWEFAIHEVDYAVLETGLGGLYDGTNVVTRSDKVCVITDIGYDHMNILGSTIEEIAAQKAGIIHNGNIVFMHRQSPAIMEVINARVADKNAVLNVVEPSKSTSYQQRNWELAVEAAQYIASRDDLSIGDVAMDSVYVPARMEVVSAADGSSLVVDGAHNEQKMKAFVQSYSAEFPEQKAVALVSFKQGKEFTEALKALNSIVDKVIVTRFTAFQDVPFRAADTAVVSKAAKEAGIESVIIDDYEQAFAELMGFHGPKIVTGSFYLIGQVRTLEQYPQP